MLSIGALRTVCDRREMINEKMKILQDLVPGCNKVIGKELIINYMQLLQHQVEKLLLVIGKLIEAVVAKGGDSVHYGRGFNLVKGGTTAKQ
ncbi:hypothetical protein CsSME_00042033 [Camellia sinensis var. sinensis]|uniref:transcription factor BHLH094-like n=2 Tax=Camellia sinensis TaxID=4442 RepID=UPI001036E0A9|nr:transcription factor BHLH094-like [Camellia sinensis]